MANPTTTSDDLQSLRARAAEICANTVFARSRSVYRNSHARFIVWLLSIRSPILQPAFVRRIAKHCSSGQSPPLPEESYESVLVRLPTDQKLLRTAVTQTVDGDPPQPPIRFQELRADDFVAWLLTLRTATGAHLSFSALNTHRAGLFNLFRAYKVGMSKTLERVLADHLKGLKRSIAKDTATGVD